MSSSVKADYNVAYQIFENKLNDPEICPCVKLDQSRLLQLKLIDMFWAYWPRPCLKYWPCLFEPHHYNIQDLQKRLAVIQMSLLRQCETVELAKRVKNGVHISDNPLSRHI